MRGDIADALIARGNVARAALVLQRQGRLFLREGWWDLAAAVLQRLLHCQKLLMQVSSQHRAVLHACSMLCSIKGCQGNNQLACRHLNLLHFLESVLVTFCSLAALISLSAACQ